jgi:hypothetical protein
MVHFQVSLIINDTSPSLDLSESIESRRGLVVRKGLTTRHKTGILHKKDNESQLRKWKKYQAYDQDRTRDCRGFF